MSCFVKRFFMLFLVNFAALGIFVNAHAFVSANTSGFDSAIPSGFDSAIPSGFDSADTSDSANSREDETRVYSFETHFYATSLIASLRSQPGILTGTFKTFKTTDSHRSLLQDFSIQFLEDKGFNLKAFKWEPQLSKKPLRDVENLRGDNDSNLKFFILVQAYTRVRWEAGMADTVLHKEARLRLHVTFSFLCPDLPKEKENSVECFLDRGTSEIKRRQGGLFTVVSFGPLKNDPVWTNSIHPVVRIVRIQ